MLLALQLLVLMKMMLSCMIMLVLLLIMSVVMLCQRCHCKLVLRLLLLLRPLPAARPLPPILPRIVPSTSSNDVWTRSARLELRVAVSMLRLLPRPR